VKEQNEKKNVFKESANIKRVRGMDLKRSTETANLRKRGDGKKSLGEKPVFKVKKMANGSQKEEFWGGRGGDRPGRSRN